MDFSPSDRVQGLRERVREFIDEHVMPVEAEAMRALDEEVGAGVAYPPILVELRERAKAEGLWNLFLPDEEHGPGLTNWEYGMLCEDMGRAGIVAPMAFNCSAPDTGNMEILAEYGTPEQKERWLAAAAQRPRALVLLDDRARDRRLGPDGPRRPRGAGGRRVGDQRPQVVHLGLQRRRAWRSRWWSPTPTPRRTSARA